MMNDPNLIIAEYLRQLAENQQSNAANQQISPFMGLYQPYQPYQSLHNALMPPPGMAPVPFPHDFSRSIHSAICAMTANMRTVCDMLDGLKRDEEETKWRKFLNYMRRIAANALDR